MGMQMNFRGPKELKEVVRDFLHSRADELKGKVVVDIPAGYGITSSILKQLGANVKAFDLFPEFFDVEGLECEQADLSKSIPMEDSQADYVICQEGVEHLSDQMHMFREFNRVLKKGGKVVITTPNYSNLKSKLSYLLAESEYAYRLMPPNEIDSVWHSASGELYFGHIFLIGIQRLRVLAKLAGFRIKKVHDFTVHKTSFLLMLFFYPFILLLNILGYRRAMRKKPEIATELKQEVYGEAFRYNIDPGILSGRFLFVELEKETELEDITKLHKDNTKHIETRKKEEIIKEHLCD